ncbi:hypothetical protein MJN59_25370, partial [Salmonella enterica subsp. enterica serovar Anatum]|nr:hypothetical protein [Salmonella enterica subsp. enterica serovar Anatum]
AIWTTVISAWEIIAAGWRHKRLIRLTGFVGPVSIAPPGNTTLLTDTETKNVKLFKLLEEYWRTCGVQLICRVLSWKYLF